MTALFFAVLIITALFQIFGAILSGFFLRKFCKKRNLLIIIECFFMMIVSLELIYFALKEYPLSILGVIFGILALFVLNICVPHKHEDKISRLSFLVFIAMCLHEFPEGIAFASSYLLNQNVGLLTAVLIALHNIPEGGIVALPFLIRKRPSTALKATAITQILYVAGGGAAFIFLVSLSTKVHAVAMTVAAGAMIFVVIEEIGMIKK